MPGRKWVLKGEERILNIRERIAESNYLSGGHPGQSSDPVAGLILQKGNWNLNMFSNVPQLTATEVLDRGAGTQTRSDRVSRAVMRQG